MGYKNYYSKDFGTLRPITKEGKFYEPFDPKEGANFAPSPGFHEGNAWNYTFFVPHDINGLVKLMGGDKKFVDKLQSVFDEGNSIRLSCEILSQQFLHQFLCTPFFTFETTEQVRIGYIGFIGGGFR